MLINDTDIQILMNTIHNPSILNSPAATSWIPICLPKFNPSGFVNAYISFLRKDSEVQPDKQSVHSTPSSHNSGSEPSLPSTPEAPEVESDSGIALVCISGGGEFESIRSWCDTVTQAGTFSLFACVYLISRCSCTEIRERGHVE